MLGKMGEYQGLVSRVKRREVGKEEGWEMAPVMKVIEGLG